MTWLWRICSSALALSAASAATLVGTVELVDSREASVRRQKDYSGVVVWLEGVGRSLPLPPPKTYTMEQRGKRFRPHVLAIPVGATVDFPNFDPIFHNAFSNFHGQPFDTGLYAPGTSQKVVFRRDGVVRVFCNIHSSMSAVIVVVRSPYVAVSPRSGEIRFEGVVPDEYVLKLWHERASEATLAALERRVRVEGSQTRLPPLRISESGYLVVPHKNKYGKQYPPEPADGATYPGARR